MDIQARYPTTADEFLRWNEGREGKREFVGGRVIELMIHVTRNHVRLATSLVVALRRRLAIEEYDVGPADFAVRTPDGVRCPDIFVDRRTDQSRGSDLAATEPVLLAEVLSPSSYARDFVEKLADYQGVPAALHYLILSQDEPRVWLSTRMPDGWSRPEEHVGEDAILAFPAFGIELPLAELYAGVERR